MQSQYHHAYNISQHGATKIRSMIQNLVQIRCLVYSTTIVHLPGINELPASPDGDLLRIRLVHQGLDASLDRVHRIAGTRHLACEILQACGPGYLKEAVRDAEAKSCGVLLATM